MLVNYFARELSRWQRYDEFELGAMSKLCSVEWHPPRAVRKARSLKIESVELGQDDMGAEFSSRGEFPVLNI